MQPCLLPVVFALLPAAPVVAEEQNYETEQPADSVEETSVEAVEERRVDEAAGIEDVEARRRALAQAREEEPEDEPPTELTIYGSARVHWINTFDLETLERKSRFGDGNSRMGLRGSWRFFPGWWLFGTYEAGFDLVENFSTRGEAFGDGGMTTRLAYLGLEHENLTVIAGQNWSAYYQVAGVTDRFAIFGGSASGIYNAGTAGQQMGTGRAEDVVQARTYVQPGRWAPWLKPFNLNLQYQAGQPIPGVDNAEFDYGIQASAFLETQREFSVGVAYSRSVIADEAPPAVAAAGISGDAQAFAMTTRMYGKRWYAALLYSRLKNMEITDQGRYFDANGLELYAQWEVIDKWWLIGGYNWLEPDDDDPAVGAYRVQYAVLGGRYSFRSFERMLYAEYRVDNGRIVDGRKGKDEFTVGVRWDFGG
jgi:predicted porin